MGTFAQGVTVETMSPAETIELGRRVGQMLEVGDVVSLIGDLGTGKTQFAKGIGVGDGVVDVAVVTSPTFVLLNVYDGRVGLHHYDFYRMDRVDLESLSYFDVLRIGAAVVEWGDKAGEELGERLEVSFEVTGPMSRRLGFRGVGAKGISLLERTFREKFR